jgi:catechol 2,3-dioxygenase-like lactoylglutathione lyase family enzyme
MQVLFISSVSVVVADPAKSRQLFVNALGLPLAAAAPGDDYFFSEKVDGSKHFGVWPLAQAAQACFGTSQWPADRPAPQVSIEFEVENEAAVEQAGQELESQGFELIHHARKEPWGQSIARLLNDDGAIIGISYTPWMHQAQG